MVRTFGRVQNLAPRWQVALAAEGEGTLDGLARAWRRRAVDSQASIERRCWYRKGGNKKGVKKGSSWSRRRIGITRTLAVRRRAPGAHLIQPESGRGRLWCGRVPCSEFPRFQLGGPSFSPVRCIDAHVAQPLNPWTGLTGAREWAHGKTEAVQLLSIHFHRLTTSLRRAPLGQSAVFSIHHDSFHRPAVPDDHYTDGT